MRAGLRDTVRMEIRRMATVRTSYLITGAAVLLGGVIALLIALLAPEDTSLTPTRTTAALTAGGDTLPMSVVGGLMALLGIASVGHDYRFGLGPALFTVQPRRGVVMGARLSVLAAVAAAAALAVAVIGVAVCWVLGRPPAHDMTTMRVTAAHIVLAVLWAWLGAGLGWVLRSSAGAVSLLLLGPLVAEPLLTVLGEAEGSPGTRDALRWLPFTAARQALGRQFLGDVGTIGALAGGLVFAGVTGLLVAGAWLLVQRRDA